VKYPADHIEDEVLSAFVDDQLSPSSRSQAEAHLAVCAACRERLEGFSTVAGLLRRLPEVEPPRDFALGPRLLGDPPNVVRLRRWYTATRAAAAALAAVFVFLSAGALYVDSRPAASTDVPRAQVAMVPAAAGLSATTPTVAARSAAAPAAARPAPLKPQADDQVAATTSVNPLPTPVPTPEPTPAPVSAPVSAQASDAAVLLRGGALIVGLLAIAALLAAVRVRRRLTLEHSASQP
jgi:anti-sigma factor RsiW